MNKEEIDNEHLESLEVFMKHHYIAENKHYQWVKKRFKELQQKVNQLEEKEELHLNRIDELTDIVVKLETNRDEAIEYIKNNTKYFDSEYVSIYGELCDIAGAGDTRTHCVIGDEQLLEILERGKE